MDKNPEKGCMMIHRLPVLTLSAGQKNNNCCHQEAVAFRFSFLLQQLGASCPHFHTSSRNGVFLSCPLAAIVFLPTANFFAACKEKTGVLLE